MKPESVEVSSRSIATNNIPCPSPLLVVGKSKAELLKDIISKEAISIDCSGLDLELLLVEPYENPETPTGIGFRAGALIQAATRKGPIFLENIDQAKKGSGGALVPILEALCNESASCRFAKQKVTFDFKKSTLGATFALTLSSQSLGGELGEILENLTSTALAGLQIIQKGTLEKNPKEKKAKKKAQDKNPSFIVEEL